MAANDAAFFRAPVPGMSLTAEPKSRPWQNPPQYVKVEDVINYYIPKLGEPKAVRRANKLLKEGLPVNTVVDTLLSAGMMEGIHTLEAGLMAAPVIREMVIANAEIDDVDYVVSSADLLSDTLDDLDLEDLMAELGAEESAMPVDMGMPEEEMAEPPKGLISRPAPKTEEMM